MNKCYECGSVDFEIHNEPEQLQRNNQPYTVDMEYSVCRQCGEEIIFPEQIKRNDSLIRDAWRKIDGLLTASEIAELGYRYSQTGVWEREIFMINFQNPALRRWMEY